MLKPPSEPTPHATPDKPVELEIGITDEKPPIAKSMAVPNPVAATIAEITKRTAGLRGAFEASGQRVIEHQALLIRDAGHERFLAEQRAADARHKAELKAADRRAGLADAMCDALLARIREFEDTLDIDEEILVALANFGQHMTIHIEELTYQDPHLLVFDGAGPNGEAVRLLQHTSQANVLLAKAKTAPGRPARRVGFRIAMTESKHVEE